MTLVDLDGPPPTPPKPPHDPPSIPAERYNDRGELQSRDTGREFDYTPEPVPLDVYDQGPTWDTDDPDEVEADLPEPANGDGGRTGRTARTGHVAVPVAWDDSNVTDAFATHLTGRWLYVATWGQWLRWDGRRWCRDDTEAVHETARQWVLAVGRHVFTSGTGDDVRKCARYRARTRLDAITTMVRRVPSIAARSETFDANPDLLTVRNGTVDLRTGQLRPHDQADRITKLADADYAPDAIHSDVEKVLNTVSDEVRPWLQKTMGYAATGHTNEDVVMVLDGRGANGKTTLLEAIGAALGDYADSAPAQLVMAGGREHHPTIKADLVGKRLVWVSETEEDGSFRMEQVKALTGGDRIKARFMRGDFFSFTPTHTLIIATNHRPKVNNTDHASWRRLRLVPFTRTYSGTNGDPGLRSRLRGDAQRRAMLAWIVAGAVEWHRDGLGESIEVTAATQRWRDAEDVILRFIEDELVVDPDGEITGRVLYEAYRDWCTSEGRPPKSNKNFAAHFLDHETIVSAAVAPVRRSSGVIYRGIRAR